MSRLAIRGNYDEGMCKALLRQVLADIPALQVNNTLYANASYINLYRLRSEE